MKVSHLGGRPMDVKEIMTKTLVTASVNDTVGHALRLLEDQEIRHLPIVNGTKLVGMVSDRDLREYRLPLLVELNEPKRADAMLQTPLFELMKEAVLALETHETLVQAIDLLLQYGVGAAPVVERDSDDLVGIVSYVDVLRALRPIAAADE